MPKLEESLVKDSKQYLLSYSTDQLGQAHHLAKLYRNAGNFDLADLRMISLLMSKAQIVLEELRTSVTIPAKGMDVVS